MAPSELRQVWRKVWTGSAMVNNSSLEVFMAGFTWVFPEIRPLSEGFWLQSYVIAWHCQIVGFKHDLCRFGDNLTTMTSIDIWS